jgi:hypothetical protein
MIDLPITALAVRDGEWRKSSRSAPQGNDCVEVAAVEERCSQSA